MDLAAQSEGTWQTPAMSQHPVRRANLDDLDFLVSAQVAMAKETEDMALDPETVRKGVLGILERPDRGFYLIADVEAAPRVCMLVLSEWSDWRNREVWWLHSVFVAEDVRRLGLFRTLYAHVRELGRSMDIAGLRLYVDKRNLRAQAVYQALGMTNEHYDLYEEML